MNVSKITVLKGRTVEKKGEWKKVEYGLEIDLNPQDSPELARTMGDTLLDSWLKENEGGNSPQKDGAKSDKKTCAFSGCSKEIDPKYRFCYEHFQKIRGRKA